MNGFGDTSNESDTIRANAIALNNKPSLRQRPRADRRRNRCSVFSSDPAAAEVL